MKSVLETLYRRSHNTHSLSLAQSTAQQQLLFQLPHTASQCHYSGWWSISNRKKKKNYLHLLFLVHGITTQTWHSNGTTAGTCSPELVIPYSYVKERHLFTHSWRAGFHVLHSPVSIMHRKVQISHLLLFSGKSNSACPLPQWHSSHLK